MFELGTLALSRAVGEGIFDGWELDGIGTVGRERRLDLGGGRHLRLLPRLSQRGYRDVLGGHDVGLALMYTPHPSLVPLEMASAGMLAVTNTFAVKTRRRLQELSSNLVPVEPTLDGVVSGLAEAAAAVEDVERRAAGSHVAWSADWETSFDDAVIGAIRAFLESGTAQRSDAAGGRRSRTAAAPVAGPPAAALRPTPLA
jgi:hypothetical protein